MGIMLQRSIARKPYPKALPMTKKTAPRRGRQPQDPRTIRSERLVLRVHPDLMATLDQLARESIVSRSQLVERTLISFCNMDPRIHLDLTGRRTEPGTNQPNLLATPADFQRRWKGFAALRAAALGQPEDEFPDYPPPPEGT
jgi:hypothetical protein